MDPIMAAAITTIPIIAIPAITTVTMALHLASVGAAAGVAVIAGASMAVVSTEVVSMAAAVVFMVAVAATAVTVRNPQRILRQYSKRFHLGQ